MDEDCEFDDKLRLQLAYILDLWAGQNHSPQLYHREIQELLGRGYIDKLGNVTLSGFEFPDAG